MCSELSQYVFRNFNLFLLFIDLIFSMKNNGSPKISILLHILQLKYAITILAMRINRQLLLFIIGILHIRYTQKISKALNFLCVVCFDLQLQSIRFLKYFVFFQDNSKRIIAKMGCFSIKPSFTWSGRELQQKLIKSTQRLLFSQLNRYLDQTKSIHSCLKSTYKRTLITCE